MRLLDDICSLRRCDQFTVDARRSLCNHRLCLYMNATWPRAIAWELTRLRTAAVCGLRHRLQALRTADRSEEHECTRHESDPEFECGGHTFTISHAFGGQWRYGGN